MGLHGNNEDELSIDIRSFIKSAREQRFALLLKSEKSQVYLASLAPGDVSSRSPARNGDSDQLIFFIEGRATAKVGEKAHKVGSGGLVLVPAGRPHQVINTGAKQVCYLGFLAPPAY